MKTTIKRIVACVLFCALLLALVFKTNGVVLNKVNNRYFILQDFIEKENSNYDVQAFGSCHTYTSFNPTRFKETTGTTSYVFANPGEIIPTTYLRMLERFKVDVPDVALVDIWGLNAYETYSTQDDIFNFYMPVNVETIPFSFEKLEVIRDYNSLDIVTENLAIAKYKDRILNLELNEVDFKYSFPKIVEISEGYVKNEMTLRKNNNGFAAYNTKDYTKNLVDYNEKQAKVSEAEKLAYEKDIVKYINKIIDLCEKYDVELVFYRAPYISTENELKKSNWFKDYCKEKDVAYYDLEEEIEFDTKTDFMDYHHLNVAGAEKATDYLAEKISSYLE